MRAHREATLQKQKDDSTARMLADLAVDRANNPNLAAQDRWNPEEEEQGDDEEDDGGELNIIDKSASISPSGNSVLFPSFVLSWHVEQFQWNITGSMSSDRSRRGLSDVWYMISPFGILG